LKALGDFEVWFLTGSQDLYGEETLRQVAENSKKIASGLDGSDSIPVRVVWKPVVKNPEAILATCVEASATDKCVGVITWMHTFSPAKMWIAGLQALTKPLLHLHTQFNRDLPWTEIDMDFMNLNQAAHGDREFAHIEARLGLARKTVAGHWQEARVQDGIGTWCRAACGLYEAKHLKLARFGDNMRNVAVTEGDKVSAQMQFGVAVNGFSVSDLGDAVRAVADKKVDDLIGVYEASYDIVPSLRAGGPNREALREAARIEIALREFMVAGGFGAITDTFENLDGLKQLPGIAVQRLMADGYGFGAEGDWKTAVMVRLVKVMAKGLPGGTSFMEDYTYHFDPVGPKVLGAHMLEVCPTISDKRVSCEIHPLSIGGRSDPVRLVFDAGSGPAIVAALMDMGDRFRIVAIEIDLVPPDKPMAKLPVGRAF
jgi:L-arabinose isomerase